MTQNALKTSIRIAVRSLVEFGLRSGDLVLEFTGTHRTIDAIRAHQKVQRSRPENYQAEAPITYRLESGPFQLDISGRIDGIYPAEPSRNACIEEIKTTTLDLTAVINQSNPLHWGQAKAYAFMYAAANDLSEIDIQLTYYQLDTGKTAELRETSAFESLEDFFNDLVQRYLKWANLLTSWQQTRNRSIGALAFPFENYRPGQRQMAVEIYRVIRERRHLILQAPTGIGKTMGALFPAIKSITEGLTDKLFYLTARTTGRTVAEKALSDLKKVGLRLKSLTLTAKDKICFCPDAACNPEECEFTRGYYDRLNAALVDGFEQDALTRSAVEALARKWSLCPFELSLELSLWVDCVICDYNYAFDPRVYLRRFFQESLADYTFLVDEAHNLVDRAREMFSAEIVKQPVLDLRREVGKKVRGIYQSAGRVNLWLARARNRCDAGESYRIDKDPPQGIYDPLQKFLGSAERWLSRNRKAAFRERLLDVYFSASAFMRVADNYDSTYATFYNRNDDDLRVRQYCIDPSRQLKDALTRCRAAIFFSATMTPVNYFKDMFGCDTDARHLILPSPFPAQNLGLYIDRSVSTLFRQRAATAPRVVEAISAFVSQRKGNYLLFFPSYAYMETIYALFRAGCPQTETIRQQPNMPEGQRTDFLNRFRRSNPDTLVGFAVLGGVFGEGIDLVGERLSGAVIVGVGLPGLSPERDLIRDYFSAVYQAGFEYAYLYPGLNRVLQAAGRVIRTETDRGVVLLVDQRFGTRRYRSLLPQEWRPQYVADGSQLRYRVTRFWQRPAGNGPTAVQPNKRKGYLTCN